MRLWTSAMGVMMSASIAAHAQVLSWQGVGSVRLGMTVAEAERALHAKLGPVDLPFSKECYVTGRADGRDKALSYVVVNGKIVVMTVFLPNEQAPDPNIVDDSGIGVGSTEDDIIRAYGKVQKELAPDFRDSKEAIAASARERAKQGITRPEPSPEYWIVVEGPDHKRAIIFETRDQKVLHFEIGLKPEILSSEHCI
jgi:hypothetical protein